MTRKLDEYDHLAAEAGARVAEILKQEGAQAQALFDKIARRYDLTTAKLLFERCIKLAIEPSVEDERNQYAAQKAKANAAQRARALTKLPTLEQISVADRDKICHLYYRWPDRSLTNAEQKIFNALLKRYVSFGGDRVDFNPEKLPPIKKQGSIARSSPNLKLPAIFDREFAELSEQLGRKPKQDEVAAAIISKHGDRYGADVDNVVGNWKYRRKKKI
jgi:hypothetical protein